MAAEHDKAVNHPGGEVRKQCLAFVELMIPVVKGWSTEIAIDVASTGIQVHGGMGYMEETGAAQHLRDARISSIYEGTTGIQANDLIGRKMARDKGEAFGLVITQMRALDERLAGQSDAHLVAIHQRLSAGVDALEKAGKWLVDNYASDLRASSAGAVPFLMLFGFVAGGWQMARAALVAQKQIDGGDGDPFYAAKVVTARFYADHFLTRAAGLASSVTDGAIGVMALPEDQF